MKKEDKKLKKSINIVIFKADTFYGKLFDVSLLIFILLSIINVMLISVDSVNAQYGSALNIFSWIITIFFTLEYILRIYSSEKPLKYIFSFFGIIDFLAILPGYLSIFISQAQVLSVLRVIRLLRIFVIFRMGGFLGEAQYLLNAIKTGFKKIVVFLGCVISLVIVMGALMYIIEGPQNGFTSIPVSMYWAIVTLTTVGYGDIAPQTVPGQALAAFIMLSGYGIIAVPTGILSAEIAITAKNKKRACPVCGKQDHQEKAQFCSSCGNSLEK